MRSRWQAKLQGVKTGKDYMAAQREDWRAAREHREESITLLEKLAAEFPEQADYRESLIASLNQGSM